MMAQRGNPTEYARGRVFHHGGPEAINDTHLRSAKERGATTNFSGSQRDRVYATPKESLAWDYAEHTSAVRHNQAANTVPALHPKNVKKTDWSTDPTQAGRVAPRVSHVELEGDVKWDPNRAKMTDTNETVDAFTAPRARILGTDTIPKGAQTSMLPHPEHGGRYSRMDKDAQAAAFRAKGRPAGSRGRVMNADALMSALGESVNEPEQLTLFGSEVGRPSLGQSRKLPW